MPKRRRVTTTRRAPRKRAMLRKRGKATAKRWKARRTTKISTRRRVGYAAGRRHAHLVNGGILARTSHDTVTHADSMAVASGVAAIAYKSYWANQCYAVSYDQSTTTGDGSNADALITSDEAATTRARGTAELATIYNHYRVTSSEAAMTFYNFDATGAGTVLLWGYVQYPQHRTYDRPTDVDSVIDSNIPGFRFIRIANRNSQNWGTLKLRYSLKRMPKPAQQQWLPHSPTAQNLDNASGPFGKVEGPEYATDVTTSGGTQIMSSGDTLLSPAAEFVFGLVAVGDSSSNLQGRLSARIVWNITSTEPDDL